ncbi:VWA domain-containing protein [Acetivibrio clariflavus]|uniref:Uncharacterized membrane protein n=1 Tax=Acetivibrio clariflavus (strain DSM 19732 / NBRC 101661 / EBR45) TaxID=720554 RepID=G8LSB4_ACECE|nr:VWA domain-containing protein [Acetivibrio clariflavus]AEV67175.1 uncharacterized membrane protein [Acetivibrio clariflavus DSM 19732]
MVFRFNYPLLLLLIPIVVAFVLFRAKRLFRLAAWRRRLIVALRVVVAILLILCISGFGLKKTSDSATTVFVVDSSDSAANSRKAAEDFIRKAIKSKKSSDKVAVVNFGTNTAVEAIPSENINFTSIQTEINGKFTDIEQALKNAAALIPAEDRKRIVLISDGEENAGDAQKAVKALAGQGISLDVYPVGNEIGDEVLIKKIDVPETLRLNDKFEVSVKISSNVKTTGKLKLYKDRELANEISIDIQEGDNNFVFSDTALKGGVVTYSAEIVAEDDTLSQNNKMSSFSYIEDKARILVIHDKDEGGTELAKIMETDAEVQIIRPENVPVTMEELQKYDGFIMSNVSAEKVDDKFLDNLEICIRHLGKGLLVTGGSDSYALGGYYKTVLEKVLPVNMDIKTKEEDPNLGLVMVIDKSGSMADGQYGVSKVELAKEAAIRATEALKSNDMVGVLAFDSAYKWVVKTKKADNLKSIQDDIGTIRADGGTSILPALEEAYLSLKDADTKLKHIILLTDGQAERTGYSELVNKIREAKITLSTVAVGSEADTLLLKALAAGGGGRFYATDEFTDIPKIFAKETFLAGKSYLNNRTFTPKLTAYSPILSEIESIPSLDGYVGTSAKSTARVIFSSDQDDPILATWQYGLGRTAAWTSDAKGMWTSSWMQWEQSPRFWKNLISWLIQKKVKDDYSLTGGIINGKGNLELTLPADERLENETVEATIVSPGGKEEIVKLEPISPGVYRGSFTGDETGVYIANVSVNSNGETVKNINSGIIIPYSPEYDRIGKSDGNLLEKLAVEGGGRILSKPEEVFSGQLKQTVAINDMTNPLLILVIILLMLDIALRRLNIPFEKLEPVVSKIAEKSEAVAGMLVKQFKRERKSVAKQLKTEKVEEKIQKPVVKVKQDNEIKVAKKDMIKEVSKKNETDSDISKILAKQRNRKR